MNEDEVTIPDLTMIGPTPRIKLRRLSEFERRTVRWLWQGYIPLSAGSPSSKAIPTRASPPSPTTWPLG